MLYRKHRLMEKKSSDGNNARESRYNLRLGLSRSKPR